MTYAKAGVDIRAGDEAVGKIKQLARATFNPSVLSEIGSFGGFFKPDVTGMRAPVLVSSADGVGTKLKLAFLTGNHRTIGEDLVNHCINDILVHGAKPLFFLDYIATGKLLPNVVAEIVEGIARGCRANGVALLGGETAEMPDFYSSGEYDLAGFIVGIVDQEKIVNGTAIESGDVLIGLPSNGLHTNGYTLARKVVFDIAGHSATDRVAHLQTSIGDALMAVHRCYASVVFPLLERFEIHGMAHITGGGIEGNLSRIIPDGLEARVKLKSWPVPAIFNYLHTAGDLDLDDMFDTFNMGVGYILVAPSKKATEIMETLASLGEKSYRIGEVQRGSTKVVLTG